MKISSLFQNIMKPDVDSESQSKSTDSFADTLAVDFKRAASDAIYQELQKLEGKYLSSTLKQSYFPIEAIAFHPIGHSTAMELEEFFRIHAEIDASFEKNFFNSVLQKEYKTKQGGLAILQPNLIPVIQPNESSLDNPTPDESYQISLRGNKKRITASVRLGSPKQRVGKETESTQTKESTKARISDSFSSARRLNDQVANKNLIDISSSTQEISIALQISDGSGISNLIIKTPFIVGRNDPDNSKADFKKITINGMYTSRKQLIVFQLNSSVYAFIPEEAKLCAIANTSEIIEHMHLIEISANGLEITFGQPPKLEKIAIDKKQPQLYPTIVIRKINTNEINRLESTPIPGITK
jgi:hypothetical protein